MAGGMGSPDIQTTQVAEFSSQGGRDFTPLDAPMLSRANQIAAEQAAAVQHEAPNATIPPDYKSTPEMEALVKELIAQGAQTQTQNIEPKRLNAIGAPIETEKKPDPIQAPLTPIEAPKPVKPPPIGVFGWFNQIIDRVHNAVSLKWLRG